MSETAPFSLLPPILLSLLLFLLFLRSRGEAAALRLRLAEAERRLEEWSAHFKACLDERDALRRLCTREGLEDKARELAEAERRAEDCAPGLERCEDKLRRASVCCGELEACRRRLRPPRRAKVHWIRAVDGHVAAEVPYADEVVLRVPAVSLEGRGGRPYAVAELRRGGEAYYVYLPAPAYYVRELSLLIFRPRRRST